MRIREERFDLNGKEVVLRNARQDEAQMLLDYLKTVSGETRFLMCDPDEIHFTIEQEENFIKSHNDSQDNLLILAFVDGEYAGNCSFQGRTENRRSAHRVGMGIALFQRFTGQGLGKLMLKKLIEEARKKGFEQMELTVVGGNTRAYRLYESMGFKECGRIPGANRYEDGSYADDIMMIMAL